MNTPQPFIQLNIFADTVRGLMNGTSPNKHGVFIEGFDLIEFRDGKYNHVEIEYAQLDNGNWISCFSYMLPSSGRGAPLLLDGKQYPTMQAAVRQCVESLYRQFSTRTYNSAYETPWSGVRRPRPLHHRRRNRRRSTRTGPFLRSFRNEPEN